MSLKLIIFVVYELIFLVRACPDLEIITRDEWGARSPTQIEYSIKPLQYAIIHHTETPECVSESDCMRRIYNIQHYHMRELNFHDIGYNFLISSDGKVFEGVGWHKIGAHTRSYNNKSIGIAFIGDFENKLPTSEAINATKKLLECGVTLGELEQQYYLIGGRQVRPTTSPGIKLYREIKKWPHWTSASH